MLKYSLEELLLRYSKNLLISHYTHIGYKSYLLHPNFRKAAYGEYSGVTIINPALTLATLRLHARFLFNLSTSNQKICFVAFEISKRVRRALKLHSHYYLINNWPFGILTNFKITARSDIIRKRHNFIPYMPAAIWILNSEIAKTTAIVQEAKAKLIPAFSVVDSVSKLSLLPYWIPANTKSGFSRYFFLLYAQKIVHKSFLVKKYNFIQETSALSEKRKLRAALLRKKVWTHRKKNRAVALGYVRRTNKFNLLSPYNQRLIEGFDTDDRSRRINKFPKKYY